LTAKIRGRGKILVQLNFNAYPVQSSLGVLGRKWALLVLMNIAFGRARRFNELRRFAPGMSKRILALRLRELESDGFLTRTESSAGRPRWQITTKGADVLPVLLTLIHFGSRWHAGGIPLGGGTAKPIEVTFSRSKSKVALASSRSPPPRTGVTRIPDSYSLEDSRGRSGKRAEQRVP
jgi:DNA-binding HxlR family transcriptional regulator